MTDFDVQLEGFGRLIDEIDEMLADLDDGGPWIVGTRVSYSIYLEFGTSDIDPKPFFRPVLAEVRSEGIERFIAGNTNYSVDQLDGVDDVVKVLALAIERRVKEIITQKGLIDTGTLRASVAAIPGSDPQALADESDIPDTGSGPPYPQAFGPAIREQIEVTN